MTDAKEDKKGCQWTIMDVNDDLKTHILNSAKEAKLSVSDYLEKVLAVALTQAKHDREIDDMADVSQLAGAIEMLNKRVVKLEAQAKH